MAKINRHQLNGGLISKSLYWSADLQKYQSTAINCDNFIVSAKGDVRKRCGTEIIKTIGKDPSNLPHQKHRIIPFVVSQAESYIIYIDNTGPNTKIDVYKIDLNSHNQYSAYNQNWAGDTPVITLTTDRFIKVDDLSQLQLQQSYNALYIAHKEVKPCRIAHYTDGTWGIEDVVFKGGPFKKTNIDRDNKVSVKISEWESGKEYKAGDSVVNYGTELTITGSVNYLYDGAGTAEVRNYWTILTVGTHSLAVGDKISVTGTANFDGSYDVGYTSTTEIGIDTGAYKYYPQNWEDKGSVYTYNMPSEVFTPSAKIKYNNDNNDTMTVYIALQDHVSTDTAIIDNPDYWVGRSYLRGVVNLVSNKNIFTADHIGSKFLLTHDRPKSTYRGELDATTTLSSVYPSEGNVELKTGGRWEGTIHIEVSRDDGNTWESIGSVSSNDADTNKSIERTTADIELIRLYMEDYSTTGYSDATPCKWTLTLSTTVDTDCTITDYISPNEVTVILDDHLLSPSATWQWAFGSFNVIDGYPATVCFHNERLMYGGTKTEPQTFWGSKIDDFTDFHLDTYATSPIKFKILSDNICNIRWMASKKDAIVIGSDSSEWVMTPKTNQTDVTVSNYDLNKHSDYGCSYLAPINSSNTLFYIQRGGQNIRSFQFDYNTDQYISPDHTLIAPQVTGDGVVAMTYQRTPDNIMWIINKEGGCYTYGYNQDQQIMSWCRQTFGSGQVISICTLPSDDGDVIYVLLRDDHSNIYLERLMSDNYLDQYKKWSNESYIIDRIYIEYDGTGWQMIADFKGDAPPDKMQFLLPDQYLLPTEVYDIFTTKLFTIDATTNAMLGADGTASSAYIPQAVMDANIYRPNGTAVVLAGTVVGDLWDRADDFFDLVVVSQFTTNLDCLVVDDVIDYYITANLIVYGDDIILNYTSGTPASGEYTITDNVLTFADKYYKVEIGKPYTAVLTPTPMVIDPNNIQNRHKVKAVYLYLIDSVGGVVGAHDLYEDPRKFTPILTNTKTGFEANTVNPYTGRLRVALQTGWHDDMTVTIKSSDPYPFQICSIGYDFQV